MDKQINYGNFVARDIDAAQPNPGIISLSIDVTVSLKRDNTVDPTKCHMYH